ncbi:MAG TPA: carboxypeptidase-like regulatory domain-containing protein, partial [Gemmatimonadaceae bacterium]|nr:carboxypeptidase-like regulatory domain-containing protein [Gemmatimonadaceae bacterium]
MRLALLSALPLAVAAALPAQGTSRRPTRHPPAPAHPAPAPAPGKGAATDSAHTVVSGFVIDSMTNLPLSGATVMLQGTTAHAVTDDGGRFRFVLDTVPEGTYQIGFFH